MIALAVGAILLVALGCWAFPGVPGKIKIILNGKANKYIEDYSKTPEGAKEIYTEAIEQARKTYVRDADNYKLAAGTLATEEKTLAKLQSDLNKISVDCERLVEKGKINEAKVLAEKRTALVDEIAIRKQNVEDYRQATEEAKMIAENSEKGVAKLERDSRLNVQKLEANKRKEEMYDRLDESRKDDTIKKLLASVNIGVEESTQRAVGAQVVHDSKLETKVTKATTVAEDLETDAYLEDLKKKYNVE